MELDPNFVEKFPYLFGDLPKTPLEKSEISASAFLQQSSTLSPPPSHYTSFLYNQCNQFNEHPLNREIHHASFSTVVPSSINPFSMISTPSCKVANTNGMTITQDSNKKEVMLERLNTSNDIWDFPKQNPYQYGPNSQSQVSPSSSPSALCDSNPSMLFKPMLQADISCLGGIGNNHKENDEGLTRSDQKQKKRLNENIEINDKDLNRVKSQWTPYEDRILVRLVGNYGFNKWPEIANYMTGRNGKQCRERWYNHLRQDIKKESWSEEEEKIFIETHKIVGNKWAEISSRLPGRTENSIKNRWNSIKRSLNATKKPNRRNSLKGTLLYKYISEIANSKDVQNNPKNSTNVGLSNVCYEVSERVFSSEDLATLVEEPGGNVPMMINGDDKMASGSGTMNYDFELYGMEFFP